MASLMNKLLSKHRISYRKLSADTGISKSTLHNLIQLGLWPKHTPKNEMKKKLMAALRAAGASAREVMLAWPQTKPETRLPKTFGRITAPSPRKNTAHDVNILLRRKTMITQEIQTKLGLARDPFDNELDSPEDVFDSSQTKRVVNRMIDAAKNCKFIAVCGPVGSSKTVCKNLFKHELKRNQKYLVSEPMIISKEKCLPSHIIHAMMDDFMYGGSRSATFKRVYSYRGDFEEKCRWIHALFRTKVADGKKLVLIIDEAHALQPETLKALKRFHELQDDFKKLIAIILIGQEELLHLLSGNYGLREVSARINVVEMNPITREVEAYLQHKFERAGGKMKAILDDSAIQQIKRLLQKPMPLALNNLVARSITEAYEKGMFPVNAQMVEEAYRSFKQLAA